MKIQVFGHRGASQICPENTMAAFKQAYVDGADGIETDVHMSKDGQLVLIHDETIDRTSNGHGWVKDMTLEELRSYNYAYHHEGIYEIPTLKELLDFLSQTTMMVNLEIKTDCIHYEGIEKKVLDLVARYQCEDRVIYSSFNLESLLKLKEEDASIYAGYLYEDHPFKKYHLAKKYHLDAIHPEYIFVRDQKWVKKCQKDGLDINTWTVNREEDVQKMKKLKVQRIIVNHPKEVRYFLGE